MAEIETGVNTAETAVVASPASETGSQSAADDRSAALAAAFGTPPANDPTTAGDAASGAGADTSLNTGAEGAAEKHVPYERFAQVNQKANEAAEQLAVYQREAAEWREAASLGIRDITQYRQAQQEAEQFGFRGADGRGDVVSYANAVQAQNRMQQELADLNQRVDLTDEARQELIAAKQERLQVEQRLFQMQHSMQVMEQQTRAQVVSAFKADAGLQDVPANIVKIIEQTPPNVVKEMAAYIKGLRGSTTNDAIAQYAADKSRDRAAASPAPEGRGGNPPPAAGGGKTNWRANVSASLASLLPSVQRASDG